jgi:heme/copper-type cytochrome/quinol oxidase subunit 3
MTRLTLPLICECLLFFVPINIYVIGNNLAQGVQWALFRYQQSYLGNSLILIHKDYLYVADGILRGSSAYSTVLWIIGAVLLLAAVVTLGIAAARHTSGPVRSAGVLTIIAGALFFAAMLVEYGPSLANSHGSSVPVGVPVIVVTGIWFVTGKFEAGEINTVESDEGEEPRGEAEE